MQNRNSLRVAQIPFPKSSDSDLVKQLTEENVQLSAEVVQLRQIIDEMVNKLAIQTELIQQLRDEIAHLKGQKPRPKIPPSKLEGPNSTSDWRKRISSHDPRMKTIAFSSWVSAIKPDIPLCQNLAVTPVLSRERSLQITRLVRLVIKDTRRIGKPGQPRGKPRKKKKRYCRSIPS